MLKSLLVIFILLLASGCGRKPIVVRAQTKPPKPLIPIKRSTTNNSILGEIVQSKVPNQKNTIPQAPTVPAVQEIITQAPQNTSTVTEGREEILGEEVILDDGSSLDKSNSRSYVTTLKTKKFSFSDAGFMRNENGAIDLQIFAVGKPILKLKISSDVCVNHNCITKREFNEKYLSSSYPEDLINNVLTSSTIMDGKNLKKTTNGFMQRIKEDDYDIKYKIAPGSIYFKDLKNRIIIKLRAI